MGNCIIASGSLNNKKLDYSNAILLQASSNEGTDNIVPSDGVITGTLSTSGTSSNSGRIIIASKVSYDTNIAGGGCVIHPIPVSKNDVINARGSNTTTYCRVYFVPYK